MWYSYNGGNKWWKGDNLPVSQFYHVSVDDNDPFQVYGGLQDNSSWVGQSQYPGGITNAQWENMYGGDGFWMFSDPSDPDYLYAEAQGGFIGRVNRRTHEGRDIQPKPNYKEKLQVNWNAPIALSPTKRDHLHGCQFLSARVITADMDASLRISTNDPQSEQNNLWVTVDNSRRNAHHHLPLSSRRKTSCYLVARTRQLQMTRDGEDM